MKEIMDFLLRENIMTDLEKIEKNIKSLHQDLRNNLANLKLAISLEYGIFIK